MAGFRSLWASYVTKKFVPDVLDVLDTHLSLENFTFKAIPQVLAWKKSAGNIVHLVSIFAV